MHAMMNVYRGHPPHSRLVRPEAEHGTPPSSNGAWSLACRDSLALSLDRYCYLRRGVSLHNFPYVAIDYLTGGRHPVQDESQTNTYNIFLLDFFDTIVVLHILLAVKQPESEVLTRSRLFLKLLVNRTKTIIGILGVFPLCEILTRRTKFTSIRAVVTAEAHFIAFRFDRTKTITGKITLGVKVCKETGDLWNCF